MSAASKKKAGASRPAAAGVGVGRAENGVRSLQISDRTSTGLLCSHPLSRDIHVSVQVSCQLNELIL